MELSAAVQAWRGGGRTVRACGKDVFVRDDGAGPLPLLVLHGMPSSSFDFAALWPGLVARRRAIALDFPGYGFSDKPRDYSYSLMEQADVVEVVARALGVTRADVWAHDMGTSVATELLARQAAGLLHFELARLVLMNGAVHAEMAHLTAAQKLLRRPLIGPLFARVASRRVFHLQMGRILARPVGEEVLDDLFALIRHRDGHLRLPRIMGYYAERVRFRERWIGALEAFPRPSLLLWGRRDPVAVFAIAERLAEEIPHAHLEALADVGHYPQLEAPTRVLDHLQTFLGEG
jgi:pimeloyl-ACP methyl ester carboxylesterase